MTDEEYIHDFCYDIRIASERLMAAYDWLTFEIIHPIVEKNYAGRGYFSWDGILDDLSIIVGQENATNILREC